ncbi:MAG TPA: alpha/beta hydrolase [Candidatus Binataceae bacterium]|nr:alpha/beta hydrolase [Candidatus Binataceae bacterium]
MLTESEQIEHLKLAANIAGLDLPEIILPRSHHIVVHRMRLHYLDWGTERCPPIVFLHGGGLNAHTWDVVCLMLRHAYNCFALDQRGHGDSEWEPTADYSFDSQIRDIEGFVEHLGLRRPLLIGHSMGGFAAMGYAMRHADKMAGLTLVDVGPELSMDGAKRIREFISQDRVLDSVDEFVQRAMAFNPMRNPALLRRSLLHNLRQLPNGKWTWKHDPNRHSPDFALEREQRAKTILAEVHRITCPTLVLRGARSDVFTDENAEKFASALPNGRWIRVPNAGHTIQGDNPRGLLDSLRPFFSQIGF